MISIRQGSAKLTITSDSIALKEPEAVRMRESGDLSKRKFGEKLGRCVGHTKLERKEFDFLAGESQDRSNLIAECELER